jgi:hypothetical protein
MIERALFLTRTARFGMPEMTVDDAKASIGIAVLAAI